MRDKAVDSIKGIAVILMVAAHTIHFTNSNIGVFKNIKTVSDTSSLVLFIIVFGFLNVQSVLLKPLNKDLFIKVMKRCGLYYSAFAICVIAEFIFTSNTAIIIPHLEFKQFGAFMDFLLLFIFYSPFLLVVRILYGNHKISFWKQILMWLSIGTVIYIGSFFTSRYLCPVVNSYNSIALVMSGCNHFLGFPLMRYIIPLTIGIIYGLVVHLKSSTKFFIFFPFLITAICIVGIRANFLESLSERWPPSLSFLLMGGVVFSLFYVCFKFVPGLSFIQKVLSWYGKHSLLITVTHFMGYIFMLYKVQPQINSSFEVVFLFLMMLHLFVPCIAVYLTVDGLKKHYQRTPNK